MILNVDGPPSFFRECMTILAVFSFAISSTPVPAEETGVAVNREKIGQVASGELTTAQALWWGFDPEDSTAMLQAALDSPAQKVVIADPGRPWIVTPIDLPSDKEILFEEGVIVEAKRGAFLPKNACLFRAQGSKNLVLRGPEAVLRMHKEDYHHPPYELAEWRHALSLRGCQNVQIFGLTLQESGGDGIYLGVGKNNATNKNILIRDVICDGNNRQGISVITAEDLVIENCTFRDTRGTAPEAGIDFEPNHPEERLVRCLLRNCLSENNGGHAYHIYLGNLHEESPPVSIRFENCVSRNNDRCSVNCSMNHREGKPPVTGRVVFEDCRFEYDRLGGICIRGNVADRCKLLFDDCTILRPEVPSDEETNPAITIEGPRAFDQDAGNITFEDCVIEGSLPGELPLEYSGSALSKLRNLSGRLIHRTGESETVWTLNARFLSRLAPNQEEIREIPPFQLHRRQLKPREEFSDEPSFGMPFRLRGRAQWFLWGEKGKEVKITAEFEPVGKASARIGTFEVATSDQETHALKPKKISDSEANYTFVPHRTGPCRMEWRESSSTTVRISSCNAPFACRAATRGMHLFRPQGRLYFAVPGSVKRFAVQVIGAGSQERVHARLLDETGRLVEEKKDIAAPYVFLVDRREISDRPEIWSLSLQKPSRGILEDVTIQVLGIPDLFAASPESLLIPSQP
jgi:hypothetical protein